MSHRFRGSSSYTRISSNVKFVRNLVGLLAVLLLAACGGGGSGGENNTSVPPVPPAPPVVDGPSLQGIFLDSAVSGLGYQTASLSGFTTAAGRFDYQSGELITFFIGDIELGSVVGKAIVTPLDLAGSNNINTPQVINLLRLLQTLDSDRDVSNGISLPPSLRNAVDLVAIDFSLPIEAFSSSPGVVSLLSEYGGAVLVDAADAAAHFQATIEAQKDISGVIYFTATASATLVDISGRLEDIIHDSGRNRLYVSDSTNRKVYFVNALNHTIEKTFDMAAGIPERLSMSPDGERLVVSLLGQPHGGQWSTTVPGRIGVFNLNSDNYLLDFAILLEPWDLVLTDAGVVAVSSSTYANEELHAYSISDGSVLDSYTGFGAPYRLEMALHANQNWLYAASTSLSPSSVIRFSVTGQSLGYLDDDNYHGDYRFDGDLWMVPGKELFISKGGDIFETAADRADDKKFLRSLSAGEILKVDFDQANKLVFTLEYQEFESLPTRYFLRYYNSESFELVGEQTLFDQTENFLGYLLVGPQQVTVVNVTTDRQTPQLSYQLDVLSVAHPCPECGLSTAPAAELSAAAVEGEARTFSFSSGGSTDNEDSSDALVSRWDWDSDGVYDTEFSSADQQKTFDYAGTKNITLQIKDSSGLVSTQSRLVNVSPPQGSDESSYLLQFSLSELIKDELHGKFYATDETARRLYRVDVDTGFVDEYIDLTSTPGQLVLSPDNSRLYMTLLVKELNEWGYGESRQGFIVEYELDTFSEINRFPIPIASTAMAVLADGKLIVAGEDDSGHKLKVFDIASASLTTEFSTAHYQSNDLKLSPDGETIYLSRYDGIIRLSYIAGVISELEKISEWGVDDKLWLAPDGQTLFTGSGRVLQPADDWLDTALEDYPLLFDEGLDITAAYIDEAENLLHTTVFSNMWWETELGSYYRSYNLTTGEEIYSDMLAYESPAVFSNGGSVYLAQEQGPFTLVNRRSHPCIGCGASTAPVASFTVDPAVALTTNDILLFNAAASSDSETDITGLLFKWDWESDGVYDTDYSSNPEASRKFNLPGSHTITLLVRDPAGLTATSEITLELALVADSGVAFTGEPGQLGFSPLDAIDDLARAKTYLLDDDSLRLYVASADSASLERYFDLSFTPLAMAISPDGSSLYVLQSAYDAEGFVAVFDLDSLSKTREFRVQVDPFDIIAMDNGQLVISGDSSDDIVFFDAATGLENFDSVYSSSPVNLILSLDQSFFYAYDSNSYEVFKRYALVDGSWQKLGGTQGQGGLAQEEGAWLFPLGDYLVTKAGELFTAGRDLFEDMLLAGQLTVDLVIDLFFDTQEGIIVTLEQTTPVQSNGVDPDYFARYYHLDSHELIGETDIDGNPLAYLRSANAIVWLDQLLDDQVSLVDFPHPCPQCSENTSPDAQFVLLPDGSDTVDSSFFFDASGSSDAEDAIADLQFRWDWNSDGVFDTDYSPDQLASVDFEYPGSKTITLAVKDSLGAVSYYSDVINVAQSLEPQAQVEAIYSLQSAVDHYAVSSAQQRLYSADERGRKLASSDLRTGYLYQAAELNDYPTAIVYDEARNQLYVTTRSNLQVYDSADYRVLVFDANTLQQQYELVFEGNVSSIALSASGRLLVESNHHPVDYSSTLTAIDLDSAAYDRIVLEDISSSSGGKIVAHPVEDWFLRLGCCRYASKYILGDDAISLDYAFLNTADITSPTFFANGDRLMTNAGLILSTFNGTRDDVTQLGNIDMNASGYEYFIDEATDVLFSLRQGLYYPDYRGALQFYNMTSYELIGEVDLNGDPDHLFVDQQSVFVVDNETGESVVRLYPHPCLECPDNTDPVADISVITSAATTDNAVMFDAGQSTDAQDSAASLQVRWDWDSDGVWDTDFSTELIQEQHFTYAGTKFVSAQIKDSGGLVSTQSLAVDVLKGDEVWNLDPEFNLQFEAGGIVIDGSRNQLIASDTEGRRLLFISTVTGLVTAVLDFELMPERLRIGPDGKLYVALLTRPHDYTWWIDEQDGAIAIVDLDSNSVETQFSVAIDPYDMVITSDQKIVIGSGSGQWAAIHAYSLVDYRLLGEASPYRFNSPLILHPNQQWVYAMDDRLTKYTIGDTSLDYLYQPYDRDGRYGDNAWILPNGTQIISEQGDIFSLTADAETDLLFEQQFAVNRISDLTIDPLAARIMTIESVNYNSNSILRIYDLNSLTLVSEQEMQFQGDYLFQQNNSAYVTVEVNGQTLFKQVPLD